MNLLYGHGRIGPTRVTAISMADEAINATIDTGIVDPAWFVARRVAQAKLSGSYCDVNESGTIGTLRGTSPRWPSAVSTWRTSTRLRCSTAARGH
jgi:hypothetical protein